MDKFFLPLLLTTSLSSYLVDPDLSAEVGAYRSSCDLFSYGDLFRSGIPQILGHFF